MQRQCEESRMAYLGRRLQKQIVAHRSCTCGRPAQRASRATPSPVHMAKRAEGSRDVLNLPVHLLFLSLFTYGSPIFKAVQQMRCKALYRALTNTPKSRESAVGAGSALSYVDGSVVAP